MEQNDFWVCPRCKFRVLGGVSSCSCTHTYDVPLHTKVQDLMRISAPHLEQMFLIRAANHAPVIEELHAG